MCKTLNLLVVHPFISNASYLTLCCFLFLFIVINWYTKCCYKYAMIANINCLNSVLINTNDPAKIAIKGMIGYNGTLYGRSIFG